MFLICLTKHYLLWYCWIEVKYGCKWYHAKFLISSVRLLDMSCCKNFETEMKHSPFTVMFGGSTCWYITSLGWKK